MTSKRILWDKHEVSLLIEAYQKTKTGVNCAETIGLLSKTLRERAMFSGVNIDDTFRNTNGISMRMAEIRCLFGDGSDGMSNTSKQFREMVRLYQTDRQSFDVILEEAKGMNCIQEKARQRFQEWLAVKAPKVQLDSLCLFLSAAEEFCLKIKVLTMPLFETTDVEVIKRFAKTVSQNKIFKIKNKKQLNNIISAANLYYDFIKSMPDHALEGEVAKSVIATKTTQEIIEKKQEVAPTQQDISGDADFDTMLMGKLTAYLKTYGNGIAKENILVQFRNYSTQQINRTLMASHAVKVLKKYYHKDSIYGYNEMADVLLDTLTKQFVANSNYTSAQQLYDDAHYRLDDFFYYNNAFESRPEIYDLAVHLFRQEKYKGNSFLFLNGLHIWKEDPNYPRDFHGLLIKYAREHNNVFSREDAVAYYNWIGSTSPDATFSSILYGIGRQTFLQYGENRFVLREALHVSDSFLSALRMQIENLLAGEDYIAFGEIDDYFYKTLPAVPANILWSPLLLEDILRIFDIGYITIEAGTENDKKTIPAAILKKNSYFRTFADMVWKETSKAYFLPKEFTSTEFREFLLNKGFIHGSEKMWNVHKTVAGDLRFYWTEKNSKVTIN